jgi:hypothetical protein
MSIYRHTLRRRALMKPQPRLIQLYPVFSRAVFYLIGSIFLSVTMTLVAVPVARAKKRTRAEAIATVRSILEKNTAACKIDEVRSISAAHVRNGWRVTAKVVMSASDTLSNETAVWTVRSSGRKAVPNNQLTAELSQGCP